MNKPQLSTIIPQTLNTALPCVMHIDLNSCFAIIEQQANRLLRGRPVGIAAYDTPRGFIVASSYQAKAKGVKLGVNVAQARALCSDIAILTPDPAKYREAHKLFKEVLLEYSPDVVPKSIDEFVVDFSKSQFLKKSRELLAMSCEKEHGFTGLVTRDSRLLHNQVMLELGGEIKMKIAERLGEYVTVNIGISTNRFLAKYAAGFGKPDGMTLIDCENLRDMYDGMKLVDLPGINVRYRARLRAHGIYTPLDFLQADSVLLRKQVFKSIVGYHWYLQLRGHELDAKPSVRRTIGHQYALSEKTRDMDKLERLLIKLCEKTGRRLRRNSLYAQGVHLYLGFAQDSEQRMVNGERFSVAGRNPNGQDSLLFTDYGGQYEHSMRRSYESLNYQAPNSKQTPISEYLMGKSGEWTVNSEQLDYREQGANMHSALYPKPYPTSWHHGEKVQHRLYNTSDIYEAAKKLLYMAEIPANVKIMSVTVFNLMPWDPVQTSLFEQTEDWGLKIGDSPYRAYEGRKRTSDAVDAINDRYGEFVITPATMLDMQGTILDRIAFGQVKDL
jgi:DNA polymerase-4